MNKNKEKLKVLITVKTYPIPSTKYNELVCTAGVRENGDLVRLYPINFRDLPYSQLYKKYQWMEVIAEKHTGPDKRKESYRPDVKTIKMLGERIPANPGNWSERAKYVLKKTAQSLEELENRYKQDRTSLGIFKPKTIHELIIKDDDREWKRSFKAKMQQSNLWETKSTREPPRKIPYKFQYEFECDDRRCKGHRRMIEDWEVGRLYWRLIDNGATEEEAVAQVKNRFLNEICSSNNDVYFYMGNQLSHPNIWLVLGVFYPKRQKLEKTAESDLDLFKK
jgi:hypothetical protein